MTISSRSGITILLVTIILSSLFFFPLFQNVVERKPQLSAYDEDWNDISDFRTSLETNNDTSYTINAILSNPAVLDDITDPSSALLIVTGIESPYTSLEMEILVRYMERGGSVLVLGDFDYSNSIANLFGIEFENHRLWDQNYKDNVSFIKTTANIGGNTYDLLLNEPVAIKTQNSQSMNLWSPGFEWTKHVFMKTSSHSWIDSDDNGEINTNDEIAPFSGFDLGVECDLSLGDKSLGSAVFISDSSLGINGMWSEEQNSEFMINLVEHMLGSEGVILFDESRHTQDTFSASLFQAALGFYFLLSGDTLILQIIRLNVLVAVIIVTMGLSFRQPEPKRWFHIFDISKPRPFRSYGHNMDKSIIALQGVFLERVRLKYEIYEFDNLSRKKRLEVLPKLLKRYNIPLDDEYRMLLGSPKQINPQGLRSIAKKLNEW